MGQLNLSGQRGLAVATAISREVSVTSEFDPASGSGIVAISSAEATAPVVQTATQGNTNSATATFGGDQASITANAENGASGEISQGGGGLEPGSELQLETDGLDLALQGQLVGQVNLSGQGGLAIATALSDPVLVEQCCILEAGASGIVAKSKAEATAPVVQTASQTNSNEAVATFDGSQGNIGTPEEGGAVTGEAVDAQIAQSDGLDLALQGQLVGQVNLSGQGGLSIATAVSDEVTVNQWGDLISLIR